MFVRTAIALLAVTFIASSVTAGPVVVTFYPDALPDEFLNVYIPSVVAGVPDVEVLTGAQDSNPVANPFHGTLDRTLSQNGQTSRVTASQDASYGEVGNVFTYAVTENARYTTNGTAAGYANSRVFLAFTLDDNRRYSLTGSGTFVDSNAFSAGFDLRFAGPDFNEDDPEITYFNSATFTPNRNDGAVITVPFSKSGTLGPGSYTLSAGAGTLGYGKPMDSSASFQFTFTATPGGSGSAIPLPPAVIPGMLMLAGLSAIAVRKRRRAHV